VPITAASSGGSSGTWYSSVNRASVVSQSRSLVRPDRKKACATYSARGQLRQRLQAFQQRHAALPGRQQAV
jgi:hypothetical protein